MILVASMRYRLVKTLVEHGVPAIAGKQVLMFGQQFEP